MIEQHVASISHEEETIRELRANHEFAVEYLKAALGELDDPRYRAVGLLALRDLAEAYGGLGAIAKEAGVDLETLNCSLSAKGNPNLTTLLAVFKAIGVRLSVETEKRAVA